MVEAARLGQLSTVRKLLDSGTATVEDQDKVSVCVRIYLLLQSSNMQNCVSLSELVSCIMPPLVGGENSTVVGITRRSPASGERVGERVQGESVSEGHGASYSCTCHSTLQFVI